MKYKVSAQAKTLLNLKDRNLMFWIDGWQLHASPFCHFNSSMILLSDAVDTKDQVWACMECEKPVECYGAPHYWEQAWILPKEVEWLSTSASVRRWLSAYTGAAVEDIDVDITL